MDALLDVRRRCVGDVPPPLWLLEWDALLRSERLVISSSGSSSSERDALGARLTWDMV